jgi:hypothetical protein
MNQEKDVDFAKNYTKLIILTKNNMKEIIGFIIIIGTLGMLTLIFPWLIFLWLLLVGLVLIGA